MTTNHQLSPTGSVQYALFVAGRPLNLASLAVETGYSVATTRKAVDALVATGVVKMVPVINPTPKLPGTAYELTARARTALSARVRRSL